MASRILSRLDDMLAALDVIDQIVATKKAVLTQIETLALERALEILSEASRHVPDLLKDEFTDVPWRQIAGLGNILRHDYRRVDPEMILRIALEHAPALRPVIETMVRRLEQDGGPN